jgi:hypothetical protein
LMHTVPMNNTADGMVLFLSFLTRCTSTLSLKLYSVTAFLSSSTDSNNVLTLKIGKSFDTKDLNLSLS